MSTLVHKETEGILPTSTYELFSNDKVVGMIQIRHKVSHSSEVPPECASHIYYEINETEQGKSYGKEILKLGKNEAKKIGLKELVVCCMEENIPSKKIIELNGGILIKTCITAKKEKMLKYIIKL